MFRVTSLFAGAVLAAGVAGSAAAQPPEGGAPGGSMGGPMRGGPGGGMQRMLFEGIALSDAQKGVIDSIQTARRSAMRARMQQQGAQAGGPPDEAARGAMMREMRTAMEQDRAAVRAVLTADQQKTFDANLARMRERRQQMQGGPGGGPGRGGRD